MVRYWFMDLKRFGLAVFVMFFAVMTIGQEVYLLDVQYPVHRFDSSLIVFEDSTGTMSVEEIMQLGKDEFLPIDEFPRHLKPHTNYWGKLSIRTTDKLSGWHLNFEDERIGIPAWTKSNGKVDVYASIGDSIIFHKKSGVEYPASERDVDAHWVLNKVALDGVPVNQKVDLVIRIKGTDFGYPPYFNLTARDQNHGYYHQIYQFKNSFNIFMFGVTLIIFLYHLFQVVYFKDKVIFWFCIWMLYCAMVHAMTIGIFIGSFTSYRFVIWVFIANGVFYSFWLFGRAFINSKEKYPLLDKMILGLTFFMFVEIIIVVFYALVYPESLVFGNVGFHYLILALFNSLSFIFSITLCLKRDKFARYFGIGSLVGSSFLVLGTLWSFGFIRLSQEFIDPYSVGMFLQTIIYSIGIAYRKHVLDQALQQKILVAKETESEIKRIKDLDEIKTQFLANISHEFKTPLTLIKGPLHRASKRNDAFSDKITLTKKAFHVINKNTNRLENLVDQLLELSKMENGVVFLQLKLGGIISFVRQIVEDFEALAEKHNIDLHCSFPEEADEAFYDEDKLEKIIVNILSNAIKYTPQHGSVFVSVNHANGKLKLEIKDSGKGIAEDDIEKIFDRFYRVESNEAQGTGIGLALTKEMVDLHDGNISVQSVKNKGTIFKVSLPTTLKGLPKIREKIAPSNRFVDELPSQIADQENLIIGPQKDINSTRKPVVLIVEDNEDLRDFVSEILEDDYRVMLAADGREGKKLALSTIPDVIVTDIMMPNMNGYEMTESLRRNEKSSHIPIIMLTAKGEYEHKMEGLEFGANAYITKPFDEHELILTIKNMINSREQLWSHFKSLDMFLVDELQVESIDDKFIQQIFTVIKKNMDNEKFKVEDIAKYVGFSKSQLHRKLKALLNKSAVQLIVEIRLNEAHRQLENRNKSVSEVAYSVGYTNLSYFTKSFKEKFGMSPSKVKKSKRVS